MIAMQRPAERLRAYCLCRRRPLGEIARVVARTVTGAVRPLSGERTLTVGIVACLQTHGSRANSHPHLHGLVTGRAGRPATIRGGTPGPLSLRSPAPRGVVRRGILAGQTTFGTAATIP